MSESTDGKPEESLVDLSKRRVPRRKVLKVGLGAGVGLAALASFAGQCGTASAPTPTTAPAAPPTTPPATESVAVPTAVPTAAPTGVATIASGTKLTDMSETYPYGGSGIADRAIEGAKALNLKGQKITFIYSSGAAPSWTPFAGEWKDLTGTEVAMTEIPIGDSYQVVMQNAVTKEPGWDLIDMQSRGLGDLTGAGALVDWTDYIKKYGNVLEGEPWGFPTPAAYYTTTYGGKVYGLMTDGDCFTLNYRKDLYDDPKEKEGFKAKYGYDMTMDTWAQYRDVCEWFTRPDKNLFGTADCRARNWGYWWWEMMYGSQANPNAYYFDDQMHPLINSPEGIAATKLYASFKPVQHPDVISWDWSGAYSSFTGETSFAMIAWPSLTKFAADKSTSKIVGKVGYGLCPGTMVNGTLIRRGIYGYGHNFMGWAHGKNPELSYLFAQWITSPEISPRVLEQPGVVDPFRLHDFIDPRVQKAYGADFLPIMKENFTIAEPDIFLRGSGEYTQILDTVTQEAYIGTKTAEDAMAEAATSWEDVTERSGRADQIAAWKIMKTYYPTLTQYT